MIFMSIVPGVLMLLSYFLYKRHYKLDEEEYDRICKELGKLEYADYVADTQEERMTHEEVFAKLRETDDK